MLLPFRIPVLAKNGEVNIPYLSFLRTEQNTDQRSFGKGEDDDVVRQENRRPKADAVVRVDLILRTSSVKKSKEAAEQWHIAVHCRI